MHALLWIAVADVTMPHGMPYRMWIRVNLQPEFICIDINECALGTDNCTRGTGKNAQFCTNLDPYWYALDSRLNSAASASRHPRPPLQLLVLGAHG